LHAFLAIVILIIHIAENIVVCDLIHKFIY